MVFDPDHVGCCIEPDIVMRVDWSLSENQPDILGEGLLRCRSFKQTMPTLIWKGIENERTHSQTSL